MNRYSINETVKATYQPVTLAECKDMLEIVDTVHDRKLTRMLKAATTEAEEFTGQMFAQRTIELFYQDVTSYYRLPVSPIRSITSIEYLSGSSYTGFTDWDADLYDAPPLIRFKSLPSVDDSIVPIKFTLEVGYETDQIPDDIQQGILFHVYQTFLTRGELTPESRTTFRNMIHPKRTMHL